MRIAICGQTYYPGNNGQAIFTIHLAEGLARVGNEVAVIVPSEDIHSRHEVINGVHVYQVRSIPFQWVHPGAFFTPLPASQILGVITAFRPDVLHIQDHYFLCRAASQVALNLSIPVMGTNHFLPENLLPYLSNLPLSRKTKIAVLWKLMLWTYNSLDVVTTPTETAARILSRQNIVVPVVPVSCGVDTQCFHPNASKGRDELRASFGLDANLPVFLYVGRLDREKRIDLLLHGLAILQKTTGRQAQVVIAGQGTARRELTALATQLGVAAHTHFLGYVPGEDLPDLYRCADIFTMPSPEELQSIATLEAMACARPVLAANARALPELVTREINGSLFEPDQPESAAREMAWLLENHARWARMGSASRSRAVAHSIENTVRRYEDLYHRLGGIHPRPMQRTGVVKPPSLVNRKETHRNSA
jgi:glycosyltransferase involved in cell wall biosynthesis